MCDAYTEKAGEVLKGNLKGDKFLGLLSSLGTAGVAEGEIHDCPPCSLVEVTQGTQTLATALQSKVSVGKSFALCLNAYFCQKNVI